MDKKFIESFNVDDYQVLTDTGWEDIIKSHKTIKYRVYEIKTKNYSLKCADNHIIFDKEFNEIYVKNLKLNDKIITKTGIEKILEIKIHDEYDNMYDLELNSNSNKRYFTNGILSHNTTSYTIFILWTLIFNKDQRILIAANKSETSREILSRIKLAYEKLPNWIKPGISVWNRGSIELSNGSRLEGTSTTSESARGRSCNILVLDEAAAIPDNIAREFWAAVYPIVSSFKNSKVIMVSTPRGVGNLFYETYENARLGFDKKEGWKSFKIDWWEVPGRDEDWKKEQLATLNYDQVLFDREFGNTFHGSSYTLIKQEHIDKFKNFIISDQWFEPNKIEIEGGFKIQVWKKPKKDHIYIIGADPSSGIGQDSSVELVFDITILSNIELVASFSSNTISTLEFPYVLAKLGTIYNGAYIAMESNSIGDGILNILSNQYEYENIIHYEAKKGKLGIFSHLQVKTEACRWLRSLIGFPIVNFKLYNKQLVSEMEWFERKKRKVHETFQAIPGKHDDFMMSFCWAMFCLKPEISENYFDIVKYQKTPTGIPLPFQFRSFNSSYFSNEEQKQLDPDQIYKQNIIGESTEPEEIDTEQLPQNLGFGFGNDQYQDWNDINEQNWL